MIRVYRCKEKCCEQQPRKFWHSESAGVKSTFTSWQDAWDQAVSDAVLLQEATA